MRIQVMKPYSQLKGLNRLGIFVLFLLLMGSILLVAASFAEDAAVSEEKVEAQKICRWAIELCFSEIK